MEELVKGDIIVIPFPFADLMGFKKRPALVLAKLQGNDIILCQITGKRRFDKYSVSLGDFDFRKGSLSVSSMIRPNRLFTADGSLTEYKIGSLKDNKTKEVIERLAKIFNQQI